MNSSVVPFLSEMVPGSSVTDAARTETIGDAAGDSSERAPSFRAIIEFLGGRMDATDPSVEGNPPGKQQILGSLGLEEIRSGFEELERIGLVPDPEQWIPPIENAGNPGTGPPDVGIGDLAESSAGVRIVEKQSVAGEVLPSAKMTPVMVDEQSVAGEVLPSAKMTPVMVGEPSIAGESPPSAESVPVLEELGGGQPAGSDGSTNLRARGLGNPVGTQSSHPIEVAQEGRPTLGEDLLPKVERSSPIPVTQATEPGGDGRGPVQVNPGRPILAEELQRSVEPGPDIQKMARGPEAKETPQLRLVADDGREMQVQRGLPADEGGGTPGSYDGGAEPDGTPREMPGEGVRVPESPKPEGEAASSFEDLEAVPATEKETTPVLKFRGETTGQPNGADSARHVLEAPSADRPVDPIGSSTLGPQPREVAPESPLRSLELETPGLRESILERLENETRLLLRVRKGEAEIQLEPPELGKIRVRLAVTDASVHGFIQVENPSVRTMLQSDLPRLSASLAESGLDLSQFDVLLLDERRSHGQGESKGQLPGRGEWHLDQEDAETSEPVAAKSVEGGHLLDFWM